MLSSRTPDETGLLKPCGGMNTLPRVPLHPGALALAQLSWQKGIINNTRDETEAALAQ